MSSVLWKLFPVVLAIVPLRAQSLQILPSPAGANARFRAFQIMIVTPEGKPLAALQWRVSLPPDVTLKTQDIEPGSAAEAANKSLRCAVASRTLSHGNAVVCVLAGGRQRIPNGAVARVHFGADKDTGSVTIRLDEALGATPEGKPVPIPDLQATMH